ncbi:hypothetical protein [Halobacteriovorax sp. DPLXC-1]|uniref:hypothetical protein n=1 Tax=Halobacteriovorax sp. DPLXC-1 TaxID=3110771 RepID=UPI002FEEF3D2
MKNLFITFMCLFSSFTILAFEIPSSVCSSVETIEMISNIELQRYNSGLVSEVKKSEVNFIMNRLLEEYDRALDLAETNVEVALLETVAEDLKFDLESLSFGDNQLAVNGAVETYKSANEKAHLMVDYFCK